MSAEEALELMNVVRAYRSALAKSYARWSRTEESIFAKNRARKAAEQAVRRLADVICANPDVDVLDKRRLRLYERPTRLKPRRCPMRPPILRFVGTRDGVKRHGAAGSGSGIHLLQFLDSGDDHRRDIGLQRRAKPDGAARLELFVDLIPVGEPVPKSPLDRVRAGRGWPWYLRSYTKSPIEVEFPLPAQPMLVCYWARWAGATGEVGRFSETCVARVEGWTADPAHALPPGASGVAIEQVRGDERGGERGALPAGRAATLEHKCVIVRLPAFERMLVEEAEPVE